MSIPATPGEYHLSKDPEFWRLKESLTRDVMNDIREGRRLASNVSAFMRKLRERIEDETVEQIVRDLQINGLNPRAASISQSNRLHWGPFRDDDGWSMSTPMGSDNAIVPEATENDVKVVYTILHEARYRKGRAFTVANNANFFYMTRTEAEAAIAQNVLELKDPPALNHLRDDTIFENSNADGEPYWVVSNILSYHRFQVIEHKLGGRLTRDK